MFFLIIAQVGIKNYSLRINIGYVTLAGLKVCEEEEERRDAVGFDY